MRILLTTDTIGGVWTFTRELTQQLLAAGDRVALVSFGRMPGDEQSRWCASVAAAWGERFLYSAGAAPLEWMQGNEAAWAGGAALLLKVAREFEPDVLHASQFCWGALPLELPKLVTAHSDVLSWVSLCKPEALEGSPWLARYRELVQRGLDGASVVVAPTHWMAGALSEHFEVKAKLGVIANGRSFVAPSQVDPRRLQAVTVGRLWDEGKGLRTLREVHSPIPILVAGEDEFEAARFGSGGLRLLGQLAERDLLRVFCESSIYLASSIYEPFGLAPLEAAFCGCAVVARDLASFREVWGEAALYFRDADELTAILRRLSRDEAYLRSAQAAARARAERYTASAMSGRYLALYRRLLNARASRKWPAHAA
jgi:glycosyltransferase involved in cell wall biosynthesis